MIRKLLGVSPRDREAIHLPRLAKETACAPVLGTLTLVIRHGFWPPTWPFRDADGCSRAWPHPSAPRTHPCPSSRPRVRSSSLDWPSIPRGGGACVRLTDRA